MVLTCHVYLCRNNANDHVTTAVGLQTSVAPATLDYPSPLPWTQQPKRVIIQPISSMNVVWPSSLQ